MDTKSAKLLFRNLVMECLKAKEKEYRDRGWHMVEITVVDNATLQVRVVPDKAHVTYFNIKITAPL